MASVRFSPLIGSMAGSVGGSVITGGLGGPMARSRPRPTLPHSTSQQESQRHFTAVHRAWTDLSAADRLTWTTAALSASKTNRVGLTRPRSARELYFATALPLAYAGAALPTAFARPVYSQPYTTIRAVAIAAEEIYISMDSPTLPVGQGFSVYGARTFSGAAQGRTPPLRHLLSTTSGRCLIDVRTPFLAHFGQPAIGERLAFRVDHWQSGSTSRTSWPLTTTVLNRGPILNYSPNWEMAWVGNQPVYWIAPVNFAPLRITTNPLQAANSWNLSVGSVGSNSTAFSNTFPPLTAGHTYEVRLLLAHASGTFSYFAIWDNTFVARFLLQTPTAPSQREFITTLTPVTWAGFSQFVFVSFATVAGNFTIDHLTIRRIL